MSEGKRVNIIITGCNNGIGLATLKGFMHEYADRLGVVIMGCRNQTKVNDAMKTLNMGEWDATQCTIPPLQINKDDINASILQDSNVDQLKETVRKAIDEPRHVLDRFLLLPLDLSDQLSVTRFAKTFDALSIDLDILILNAGICTTNKAQMFETNMLGHYHLTRLLLPQVAKTKGKIIVVSSAAHGSTSITLKKNESIRDHIYTKPECGITSALSEYGFTKLCNLWFALELHHRCHSLGIRVNALHPGVINTNIGSDSSGFLRPVLTLMKNLLFKSADIGAKPTLKLAFDPSIENVSGKYFDCCKEKKPHSNADAKERWSELWDLCETLCKEKLGPFEYEILEGEE